MFSFLSPKSHEEREWRQFCKQAFTRQKIRAKRERSLLEGASSPGILQELLPKPFVSPVLSLSFDLSPLHKVGGDFLDFLWVNPDHIGFYLFDIAGHDEELGGFALSLRELLASFPPSFFKQPERILKEINEAVAQDENDFLFLTMWCGCLNLKKNLLTYASAGSPPAIWIPETGEPSGYKKKSVPLGLDKKSTYASDSVTLEPKGSLYLMSDGAYEIELAKTGHYLSWEGLKKLLSRQDYLTPHESLGEPEEIKKLITKLAKEERLMDDFSLLKISLDFSALRSSKL